MQEFKTIKDNGFSEIIEKKSKFIGQAYYIENKEEVDKILKEIKKKYADARHNCYAYSVLEQGVLKTKSSDDGEPSGTAGIPILNVINENNLKNVLIIVTRYFGGILLGAGGLLRCYTKSAVEAINNTEIVEKELGYKIQFTTDYNRQEQLKYYLKQKSCKIIEVIYLEKIEIIAEVSENTKIELEEDNSKKSNMFESAEILEKKYIEKSAIC